MPRLESGFSVQVTQPYLNEPFPIRPVEPHEDRLFRHITFHEDESEFTLRLRAINRSYITESAVIQKKVQTNLFINDISAEPFRIKAVLSQPEHGITESHWVTERSTEGAFASSHNQYRMRGISKEGWKSDWVYSELRDFDNELIVYNMLHDILDLLTTVHDDQIDYLMDYIVSDTFIKVLTEKAPLLATSLDPEEFQTATITELLSVLSSRDEMGPEETVMSQLGEHFAVLADEMKKEFKENLMTSPEEFAILYRMYNLFDQYRERKQDVIGLLMEIFLEDRLEKLVQKTDIEVLLQNDEETGIYLNGVYEFDIKNELITSVYAASPNDSFVTKLEDAVQLLSEPVVFEELAYNANEQVGKFLRMALAEVYTPMVAMDERLLELQSELEDRHEVSVTGSIIEFTTMDEDYETRHMLLFDVVEALIKGDLELRKDYEVAILDFMLNSFIDSRKTLLIDYNLGESLEVFMNLGESFRQEYQKTFLHPVESTHAIMTDSWQTHQVTERSSLSEVTNVTLTDRLQMKDKTAQSSLSDAYTATLAGDWNLRNKKDKSSLVERYHIAMTSNVQLGQLKDKETVKEELHARLFDAVMQRYQSFKQSVDEKIHSIIQDGTHHEELHHGEIVQEHLSASQRDNATLIDISDYRQASEDSIVDLLEWLGSQDTVTDITWQESNPVIPEDAYFNLFKHFLREPHKFPYLENRHVALSHDLRDMFFMDGTELVQYALGDMDDGWPLGVFRLGINTLKGEVSNS